MSRCHRRPLLRAVGILLLCSALAGALLTSSRAHAQSCDRYLNASDGEDANSGREPQNPVRSFERAFLSFPSASVVCIAAGEYVHGADSDGIQLSGPDAYDKSMRFVVNSFGESDEVAFTEDEFLIDIGAGTLSFETGTGGSVRLGVGIVNHPDAFPANTTFLHTLAISSGTLDARQVSLSIGSSVGNPDFSRRGIAAPPSASIVRGTGLLLAESPFQPDATAARRLIYTAAGDRNAGSELPPSIRRLIFEHTSGTVTLNRDVVFAQGGSMELRDAGSAAFQGPVSIGSVTAPAVTVRGSGRLEFGEELVIGLAGSTEHAVRVLDEGTLRLRNVQVNGPSGSAEAGFTLSGTGTLEVGRLAAGPNVVVRNTGNGRLILGDATTSSTVAASVHIAPGGITELVGTLYLGGDLYNGGSMAVGGPTSLTGALENEGGIRLDADLDVGGAFVNGGTIDLTSRTLTLSGSGEAVNAGSIGGPAAASGWLALEGDVALTSEGLLTNVRSISGTHQVQAAEISGDLIGEGGSVSTANLRRIGGSVRVENGEVVLEGPRIEGSVFSSGGLLLLNASTIIEGDLHIENGGTVQLSSIELSLHGDLIRRGGTLSADVAALRLSGTSQTLMGGPAARIGTLQVSGGEVLMDAFPLEVRKALIVDSSSQLHLEDQEVRLLEPGAEAVNDGTITANPNGGLVFGGSPQTIAGAGRFANIEIAAPDAAGLVSVADSDVRQQGILTLTRGRLRVEGGSSYSMIGTPLLRRNVGDADGDGMPDSGPVQANAPPFGSFTAPDTGYDLEYFGRIGGRAVTATEVAPSPIVDLRIMIEGIGGEPAALELHRDASFRGDLEIGSAAVLDIGDFELSALDGGATHHVAGSISGSGAFILTGGQVTGAETGASAVENLTVRAGGETSIIDLKSVDGLLAIDEGALRLHMREDGKNGHLGAGNIGDLHMSGSASLTLESSVEIGGTFSADGGTVDFAAYDVVVGPEGTFQVDGPVFMRSDGGRVVFPAAGSLATTQGAIPRLLISAEPGDRTELLGRTAVSESFEHLGGVLDFGTSDLILDGGLWTDAGGSYDGSGRMLLTGNVTGAFAADVSLPNLTLAEPADETTFTVRSATNQPVTLIVREALHLIGGTTDLATNHLAAHGDVSYRGGRLQTSGEGALVLDGARAELADSLRIETLRIAGTSDMSGSTHPLVVEGRVIFQADSLTGVTSSNVHLATGSKVIRYGAGTFGGMPSFGDVVHLDYDFRAVADSTLALHTGGELSPLRIGRLSLDAGAGSLELATGTRLQEGLVMRSGRLLPADHLVIAAGGSVHLLHTDASNPRFEGGTYTTAGPISLIFESTQEDVTSSELTFPSGADVDSLLVHMGNVQEHDDLRFALHADRSIGSLIVDHRTAGSAMDLNGVSLAVRDGILLEHGILTSADEAVVHLLGDLAVRPPARVEGAITMTVHGDADLAGAYTARQLTAMGDVRLSGSLGGPGRAPTTFSGPHESGVPTFAFMGIQQTFRVEAGDDDPSSIDASVNRMIVDLADSSGTVYLESDGSPRTLAANRLVLRRGILSTGPNDLRLPHDGNGVEREEDATSHVAGRISRELQEGQPNAFTDPNAQFAFPLGTGGPERLYRPFLLDFAYETPASAATVITAGHVGGRPPGYRGLPVDGGGDARIDDVADLYWTLHADPTPGSPLKATIGAFAAGFEDFSAARALRLLRRGGSNPNADWALAGSAGAYDNALIRIGAVTAPYIQLAGEALSADQDGLLLAPGVAKSEIRYARIQFANLLERDAAFVINDTIRHEVASGGGTAYLRTEATPSVLSLRFDARTIVYDSVYFEPGRDYFAAAVHGESTANRRLIAIRAAGATPQLEHRDAVSVGFFNALPDVGPVTLRRSDENRTLYADVGYASHSPEVVALPPEDVEFSITAGAREHDLASLRSNLHGVEGLTVMTVAHPILEHASFATQLTLIDSQGDVVPSNVHVAREEPAALPGSFVVHGNFPNPFNPTTRIRFDLPVAASVTVALYDVLGRRVHVLSRRAVPAGAERSIEVEANSLASGTYLYRVIAETPTTTLTATGHMTLVR